MRIRLKCSSTSDGLPLWAGYRPDGAVIKYFLMLLAVSSVAGLHGAGLQLDWQQLIAQAEGEYMAGRLESSKDLYVQALGRVNSESQRAFTFGRLGLAHVDLGNYTEALPYYNKALSILSRQGPSADGNRADVLSSLSALYFYIEQYAKAESLSREALKLRTLCFGPRHSNVALSWQNLAAIQHATGRTKSALESYLGALATLDEIQPEAQSVIALIRSNMALLYLELKQGSQALEEATAALLESRKLWGDNHPVVGRMMLVRGTIFLAQNRLVEAGNEFNQALGISETTLGAGHPHVGEILHQYAELMRKTGRKKEAKQMETRERSITAVNRKRSLLDHTVDVSTLRRTTR